VAIDREHIETVIKPELEAREKHGAVAQEFELEKLRVAAQKDVQVAFAQATAKLFSKMEATLYGTPQDVSAIMDSVVRGQTVAKTVEGFLDASGPTTKAALGAIAKGLAKGAEKGAAHASAAIDSVLDTGEASDSVPSASVDPDVTEAA
ncbi:MAG: hypothetical protein AAF411_28630, partial [Myxococcota bacterium]